MAREEKTLSLFDLFFSGGLAGTIIIIILFVLLFVAVYIYFERWFAIKASSKTDKNFMLQIKDNVANGNIEAAKIRCAQENSPVARLTEKGIS
ncbi:MAG TPA: MotA/TolQ/ExbB proton channel family protein, partial [Flavobacteriaceae bacterium]|nr:MotA/TolQ/ExbB proton channel family protein [Flavobacteriaceae bacterium]